MLDGQSGITVGNSIQPGAYAATVFGATANVGEYDAATAYFIPGTWTDGTHTPKLQESPDGSTWTDLLSSEQIGSFTAVSSNATAVDQKVGYVGSQPYLRCVVTVAGATTGAKYAMPIILSRARKLPLPA